LRAYKGDGLTDRLKAAAEAKRNLLDWFRAQPGPDDPAVQQRQAERKAVAEAREARIADRKAAREAEAARKAEEEAARKAEEAAREAAAAAEKIAEAARARALLAEQKAARDARYAARKARR